MLRKINNNYKEKAILFLRVSSKGQEDNYSLDAQEKLAKQYAQQNNLEIVKIWKVSESAWGKKERKNFLEML
ncbi:recombinase family protein [Candidatus Ruminimicrobium bovinum]|uniref:recombinase family protein n=1 Tax=Candidatus Ruminimicrobium bovinum TaxID=3242779 RepID=UPI0039B8E163